MSQKQNSQTNLEHKERVDILISNLSTKENDMFALAILLVSLKRS